MKTVLRFSLLSMLLLLCSSMKAETVVTVDFDNDYQMLFPMLAGVSQGSDGHDGDFTGPTLSTQVQGIMVLVAPAEDASTPSRIWSSSPRLRMYSGMFTVMGDGITKIEFDANDKFALTTQQGTLDGKTWTGDEDAVTFMVSKNTQIRKIVVTMGGEVGPGPNDDDDDEGLEYKTGNITETDSQIVFDFTATDTKNKVDVTGQIVFDFVDNGCTQAIMTVSYPSAESAQAAYQDAQDEDNGYDEVTVSGNTMTAVVTSQFAGYSKMLVKKMLDILMGKEDIFTGDGTLSNPFTALDAFLFVKMGLEPGDTTDDDYYVKGKVSSILYPFDAAHSTATFFISPDGTTSGEQFECYSVYYLENKPWVDGFQQVNVGDEVIIHGKLTNYQGTPETASKKAYIYSLNGQTKAENIEGPDPQVQLVSVQQALQIIDALENGKTTAETYRVKGYVVSISEISTRFGNATFVMADSKDQQTGLTVYRVKGFDGENITDEQLFQVGDELVVEGKLQKYVKNDVVTPEVATGGSIVSINGQSSAVSGITLDAAPAEVFNLQGQRVTTVRKGLYIVNGRKVIIR